MPDQSSAATEHAILQEITGPLQTLPDDPVAFVHAEFPTAMRGYERAAVDDYVQQVSQLVAELQATRSPEAAVRRALERVGEQISGILQRAHETAEQITAQSRREAEDRLEQARAEAAQIAGAAEQRVKELDGDTDRIWLERQRIVADAEDLASQLVAIAKSAAERFPADEDAVDADDDGDDTAPYDDEGVPTVAAAPTFADERASGSDPEELGYRDAETSAPDAETSAPDAETSAADVETSAADAETSTADAETSAPDAESPAPQGEFSGEEEDVYEDGVVENEPPGAEDIEKTVAFKPLPASADHEGDDRMPERDADSDSTTVIPPASQAASRRRPRP
jgi:DivIVA domain-containing protein